MLPNYLQANCSRLASSNNCIGLYGSFFFLLKGVLTVPLVLFKSPDNFAVTTRILHHCDNMFLAYTGEIGFGLGKHLLNLGKLQNLGELTGCGEVRDLLQQEYRGDSSSPRTWFQRSLYFPKRNRRLSRGFSSGAVFQLTCYKALVFKPKVVMQY